MDKKKEKDTTVWKPKGNQKITRPSGPDRRGRSSGRAERKADRSEGSAVPKRGIGKLSLLIGAGAIFVALAKGVRHRGKRGYYNKD